MASTDASVVVPVRLVSAEGAAPGAPPGVSLSLTPKEAAILGVMRDTAATHGAGTEVRVVGGWVRDKLLGLPSHDIDVSVDGVSGVEFARLVNVLLASRGEATSSIGVIQANPDQSKHLETAATRVLGEWIDFVGLRAEEYDADSRIPRITAGTPTQDALRRDFTVNALFYNVTSSAIEDLTGRGWSDLHARVLRTPLPPLVTFRDDPLRLLRAVRFSARLAFALAPDLRDAAGDARVVTDLGNKVSRERVGIETEGMLGGPRPIAALRMLHALGVVGTVFALSPPASGAAGGGVAATAPPAYKLGGHLMLPSMWVEGGVGGDIFTPALRALSTPDALEGADLNALPTTWLTPGKCAVEALGYALNLAASSLSPHMSSSSGGMSDNAPPTAGVDSFWSMRAGSAVPFSAPTCPSVGFFAQPPSGAAPELEGDLFTDALDRLGVTSPDERRALITAAQLSPLMCVTRVHVKSGRHEPLAVSIVCEGLKRRKKDADDVVAILSGAHALSVALDSPSLAAALALGGGDAGAALPSDVLAVGLALRCDAKAHWRSALLLSLALRLVPVLFHPAATATAAAAAAEGEGVSTGGGALGDVPSPWRDAIAKLLHTHRALAACVTGEWALDGCWAWRPILNGSELRAELGAVATGPALGALMEKQARWQLLHPSGGKEGVLAHLREGV